MRGCGGDWKRAAGSAASLKKPWGSWARNRPILRTDHQDENRTILLQHCANVPGSGSQSQRPVRSHAETSRRAASEGCALGRANLPYFPGESSNLWFSAHPTNASASRYLLWQESNLSSHGWTRIASATETPLSAANNAEWSR